MRYRALVAVAVAAGLAGCGGSSKSSSTNTTPGTPTASSSPGQLLLTGFVEADAYASWLVSGATQNLAGAKTTIVQMRTAIFDVDSALRKQRIPGRAQRQYQAFLTAGGTLISRLDELGRSTSSSALKAGFGSKLVPAVTDYEKAERSLRIGLRIPTFSWVTARPLGASIYSDSLSGRHDGIKWLLANNVRYEQGGLVISTVKENGLSGPTTPYSFDGRHIAVQVEAKVLSGKPYVGITCPGVTPDETLTGQIGPGARYSFGVFRPNAASQLLRGPTASKLVKTGVNRIRLDCDQFAPGITTLRLYINGTFVDYASAPVSINPGQEAGLFVVRSNPTPSSVLFTNWKVSKLPAQ